MHLKSTAIISNPIEDLVEAEPTLEAPIPDQRFHQPTTNFEWILGRFSNFKPVVTHYDPMNHGGMRLL